MTLTVNTQAASLRPPEAPKFPFSSPITEEVESPLGSSEASGSGSLKNTGNTALRAGNRFEKMSPSQPSGQDDFDRAVYADFSQGRQDARKPRQGKISLRRSGIMKKKERPSGLRIVTNFSRNEYRKKRDATALAFIDLNDLKSLSKAREKERSVDKIKRTLRQRTGHGYEELTEDESHRPVEYMNPPLRAPQQTSPDKYELSPSDAPIVIGLKVPYEESSQRKETIDTATLKDLTSAHSQPTPVTPFILITPAKEDVPWTIASPQLRRPRVTSSIYSQPTPRIDFNGPEEDIPPVPAIPALHSFVKGDGGTQVFSKQEALSTRKNRPFSTDTVFEEDETPQSAATRGRSFSNESKSRIIHRLSVNTETNRHHSQGWWTYLLSPLLNRSSTVASRRTLVTSDYPPVPPLSASSLTSKAWSVKWWEEKETSHFSPDTPESAPNRQAEIVPWPDLSAHAVVGSETRDTNTRSVFATANAIVPNFELHGSAAEYYQACAHDLFSTEPYFECINHVCSMTPASRITQLLTEESEEGLGEKGLGIDAGEHEDDWDEKGMGSVADSESQSEIVNPNNPFSRDRERFISEERSSASPATETESRQPRSVTASPSPVLARTREFSPPPTRGAPFMVSEIPAARPVEIETSRSMIEEPSPPPMRILQEERHMSSPGPPPYSAAQPIPRYRAILPPGYAYEREPLSPGPESPGMQQAMTGRGSIPMSEIHHYQESYRTESDMDRIYDDFPPRPAPVPVTRADLSHPLTQRDEIEDRRRRLEKEDAVGRKVGGLWRGRGCFSKKGCFGRPGREGRLRRRWYVAISSLCLVVIIVAIVLATTLTRRGDATPVQSEWLNLTGYPPMPTGVLTIAGPEVAVENNNCIQPSTLWSCALPKEQQAANSPFAADQPNFRVQIRFRNGSYPNSTAIAPNSTSTTRRSTGSAMSVGDFIKNQILRARDVFTDSLYDPSPSPPSVADQTFLGNTTDNNTVPFEGEETPFFMTVLSPDELSAYRLVKRNSNETSFPNVTSVIPDPSTASDGTAAVETLYPLPVSQPVHLFNRGLSTEHYGFYTYFDRSIFLKSTASLNDSGTDDVNADQNGGSSKAEARVRCTWSQTRFLVQIWTQPMNVSGMTLLSNTTTAMAKSSNVTIASANDFTRPGSFPYAASIKLDRHGGQASKKLVYCYGMDANENIISSEKKLQLEDRGFGGTLINPAPGIFDDLGQGEADPNTQSETDGGSGGCACEWRNWILQS